MATSEPFLTQDVVFDLLSSPRRRYVLYYLRETGESIELTDLAEQVAAWENETTVEEITEQERKRVYVSLYQTHIPRLDEAGVIDYDRDSGSVALASEASEIDQYLGSPDEEFSWPWVYLLLAAASALVFGLSSIEALPFPAVSDAVVVTAIIAAFVLTAVVHTVYTLRTNQSAPRELQERL